MSLDFLFPLNTCAALIRKESIQRLAWVALVSDAWRMYRLQNRDKLDENPVQI